MNFEFMQWNGLVEMETFMSGAFKKKKWYSNKERQRLTKEERPRDSHIRIKVMSKSRIMNTQEKKITGHKRQTICTCEQPF